MCCVKSAGKFSRPNSRTFCKTVNVTSSSTLIHHSCPHASCNSHYSLRRTSLTTQSPTRRVRTNQPYPTVQNTIRPNKISTSRTGACRGTKAVYYRSYLRTVYFYFWATHHNEAANDKLPYLRHQNLQDLVSVLPTPFPRCATRTEP